jgi:hypothetical protein
MITTTYYNFEEKIFNSNKNFESQIYNDKGIKWEQVNTLKQ